MPRDGSGNYTLPQAPFQPNTLAQSAKVNSNFSDIAAALSDSLSRSNPSPLGTSLDMNGHDITNAGSVTAQSLVANGAAGTWRQVVWETAGKERWAAVAGGGAESGSNAGSDFEIHGFADDGVTIIGAPWFSLRRSDGQATFYGNLSVGNNKAIATGGTVIAGHVAAGKSGDPQGGMIGSWNVSNGAYSGFYTDASGTLHFCSADAGFGSVISERGTWGPGQLSAAAFGGGDGGAGTLIGRGGNKIQFGLNNPGAVYQLSYYVNFPGGWSAPLAQGTVTGLAFVGGSGGPVGVGLQAQNAVDGVTYTIYTDVYSDSRIKTNVRPTAVDALEVVGAIEVVGFQHTPEAAAALSIARDVRIGMVAQQLQQHVPEAVRVVPQTVEGLPRDLHTIAPEALVPYLVRAVQQLTARVAELEQGRA